MKTERKSRWEAQREAWYRESAHTRIREGTGWMIFFLCVLALVLFSKAIEDRAEPRVWLLALGGLVASATAWGLWRAHAWARWLGGLSALSLSLAGIAGLFIQDDADLFELVRKAFVVLMWFGVAVFLLQPASARLFRQARTGPESGDPG